MAAIVPKHIPAMVIEVRAGLAVRANYRIIDVTEGYGGHTAALAEDLGPGGRILGIDRDATAIEASRQRFANDPRIKIVKARISQLGGVIDNNREFLNISDEAAGGAVDAVLFDLGVSSPQLDDPLRGFSFKKDGLLDLRMSPSESGPTAADLVNKLPENQLADILYQFGEEHASRRVARAIVTARARKPITTTLELAEIVKSAVPFSKADAGRIHPATRTFQALRIAVNSELDELEKGLSVAIARLAPGGRVAVLAYHSLEDRIVKLQFKDAAARDYQILTKKPVTPGAAEIADNPRSRSAKLRILERNADGAPKTKNKYANKSSSRSEVRP
ncbi:MAG: 16S rRNA (cytosine(1402)-N(4))-methyltransferase RsmH [Planctomycetota bacterium]